MGILGGIGLLAGCAAARHTALHESAGESIRSALARAELPNPDLLAEAIE